MDYLRAVFPLLLGLVLWGEACAKRLPLIVNVPVSYRVGELAGRRTDHYYLGIGMDAGPVRSWLLLHAEVHTYLGPFMFADMNQPNEIDLGPQLSVPLGPGRKFALTLGAGPALFFPSGFGLSLRQFGGYLNASLLTNGFPFRWGPFCQYSTGTTGINTGAGAPEMAGTWGYYLGMRFQFPSKV
jgi:hypothetical protein